MQNERTACADRGLAPFFDPRSVAVIGSFRESFFGGYVIVKSLLKAGYKGKIFPVNPAYKEVHGLKVYPSLKEVPQDVDLALVMINARSVAGMVRECAGKGARGVIVVSDGFAERDEEGARLQEELLRVAGQAGIRIIGPNTAGVVNTSNGFNPCAYEAGYYQIRKGPIAIGAQTGMTNPQAFPYPNLRFGVSKICDFGNKCDVDECDWLEYLAQDPDTGVISLYLESIRDGRRLLKTAASVTRAKPVLVFKSGRTKQGAKASASHTGSMAVDDKIFDSLCRQSGMLRLEEFQDLFEMPKMFASQPLPASGRLGIITFTGGVGVVAIDDGSRCGLVLAALSAGTKQSLDAIYQGLGNTPVDIGPMMAAVKNPFDLYPGVVEMVMADPNVDMVFNVLWANPAGNIVSSYLKAYERIRDRARKPMATWVYGPDSKVATDLTRQIEEMGFRVFKSPEKCVQALGLAWEYKRYKVSGTRYSEE
ncbi:MAG: acetate--CoA ligase family protein [Deltaproteobacteria bacterium]